MKILERIISLIIGLLIAIIGFIMAYVFCPDVTKAVDRYLPQDLGSGIEQLVTTERESDTQEPDFNFEGTGYSDTEPSEEESSDKDTDEELLEEHSEESGNDSLEAEITSGYIPPGESEIVIPENVSGRNGYQQIQDEQEQVDEDTARQLQTQLSTGHTGDGLEFDPLYYPYYAMLSEKGQHIYRQIYANGNECYQAFAPAEPVTAEELKNIFSAVYNDHPELFWLETAYSGKYMGNGRCVEIDLQFNRTAQDLESAKTRFQEQADQILGGARALSGNYEREKFVHDALIEKTAYNLGAEMNQSAYSALVNGQTVCAGYARAFQYLIQQLEIPCYYCTGFAGESHAWNMVMLDDGFYHVDTTWDDTDQGRYDYFNKTDADYASSHIRRELSVYLPPCNGELYRNLEAENESGGGHFRSLEDAGMTEEQVFTDMQGYYEECYEQILRSGKGRYTFYNVIEGEDLLARWYEDYENEFYKQSYMERAMTEVGATSCEMELEAEELEGDRYLIKHDLHMR